MHIPLHNPLNRNALLGLLLFYTSFSFGQTNEIRLDSVYYYQFITEVDSFPENKQVCSYSSHENTSDCYNFSSCISSRWDQQKRRWIPYGRNDLRIEDDGQKRISIYYQWNSFRNAWQRAQRNFDLEVNNIRETAHYQWDSLSNTWFQTSSFLHHFDQHGNQTLFESKSFDRDAQIWRGSKEEAAFDDEGRELALIYYNCDEEDGSWIPQTRITQSYLTDGNLEQKTFYHWNLDPGNWTPWSMDRFYYDLQGREVLQEKAYVFDPANSPIVEEKWEKTYDPEGNLSVDTYSLLDRNTNLWELKEQTEYAYTSKRELSLKKRYEWNVQNERLRLADTDSLTYTPNGNIATRHNFYHDSTGAVQYGGYNQYTYNNDGKRILRMLSYWDAEKKVWIPNHRAESPFRNDGTRIYYASYEWDLQAEKWIGRRKTGTEYSDTGSLRRLYRAVWDLVTDDWFILTSRKYDYGPCNQEYLVPANEAHMLLYPNPVTQSWVYLESKLDRPFRYTVLDLQGREVLAGEMRLLVQPLDVRNLTNGVYMLRYQAGDKSEITKFIISRP